MTNISSLKLIAGLLLTGLLLSGLNTSSAYADTSTLSYDPAGNITTRSTSFGTTT